MALRIVLYAIRLNKTTELLLKLWSVIAHQYRMYHVLMYNVLMYQPAQWQLKGFSVPLQITYVMIINTLYPCVIHAGRYILICIIYQRIMHRIYGLGPITKVSCTFHL